MKNILFIHQSAELYGSDKTLLILLENMNRDAYHPVVVLPNLGLLSDKLEAIGIEVVVSPVLKLYRDIFTLKNGVQFLRDSYKCYRIFSDLHKKYQFDIVYSNTLAVLSGGLFSRLKGIRHLWHVHEIIVHPNFIANTYPKLLNSFADVVVCNSKATAINLTDRNKALNSKTVVVYNGIEHQHVVEREVKKSDFGFEETDVILSLVGRVSKFKGHKWLVETYNNYLKDNKDLKLLFVGSPVPGQESYQDEIQAYIKTNGFEDRVKFIPFTLDVAAIWQITDISIMPSYEPEPFGLVAIESMLANKPVIGANHGGLMEIIIDGETGYLIEPENQEKLAKAIQVLTRDKTLREQFGASGYARVLDNFSIQKYTSELEEVFNTI